MATEPCAGMAEGGLTPTLPGVGTAPAVVLEGRLLRRAKCMKKKTFAIMSHAGAHARGQKKQKYQSLTKQ